MIDADFTQGFWCKMSAYRNVCCVYTVYALFLYLVNAKDEDIDETYYVLDDVFPKGYDGRLWHCCRCGNPKNLTGKWWRDWLAYRWHIARMLPRLSHKSRLFMQDHKEWTAVYAGNHKYTYLEDSPQHISAMWSEDSKCGKIYQDYLNDDRLRLCKLLYGAAYHESFAHHPNAETLLLTADDDIDFLKGRKKIFSLPFTHDTWLSFSDYKRKRIMEIFDVSEQDLRAFHNVDTLIITQPLWPDSVSRDVHADIYSKLIKEYDASRLMIKTHPRETFDYASAFPEIRVFSKNIPIQALLMMGLDVKTMATIYSTAVAQFGEYVRVDWYGTEFDNRLFKRVGHFPEPNGISQAIV